LKTGFQKATEDISTAFWEGAEKVKNPEKIKHITDLAFSGLKEKVADKVSSEVSQGISMGISMGIAGRSQTASISGTDLSVDNFGKTLSESVTESNFDLGKALEEQATMLDQSTIDFELWKNDLAEGVREFAEMGLENIIGGVFSSIGSAISNGNDVLKSVGGAFLGQLGGIMVDMGKMAITIGIGLEGIKKALSSLNPIAAIAAGAALIALGSFFTSKSRQISRSIGSNSGGGNISTGTGGNFETPTASAPSGGSVADGRVVFEIEGRKLVGVLSRTLERNRSLGNDLSFG